MEISEKNYNFQKKIGLTIYYFILLSPLCSKKNPNEVQNHAFELFRDTFIIIEYTV